MIDTADQREFVADFRDLRENLAHLEPAALRADRLKRPANLARRMGLHVEGIELARSAEIEDEDASLVARARSRAQRLPPGKLGQAEAEPPQRARLQKIAPGHAIAGG